MIEVFDSRTDLEDNVVVRPELRGRFLRLEPEPAPPPHSHDLAGEIFLVLEGHCEFLVGDERATVGPGQLIYVDKLIPHAMHAVGDQPCLMYLSVTPHLEPTHTFYDSGGGRAPIRYDAWRGHRFADGSAAAGRPKPDPAYAAGRLTAAYVEDLEAVARGAGAAAERGRAIGQTLDAAVRAGDGRRAKQAVDELWADLRTLMERVERTQLDWNALAPQAMNGIKPKAAREASGGPRPGSCCDRVDGGSHSRLPGWSRRDL